jgi:hypothetical protein
VSSNDRSQARSVILRLRRYRDRMQEIAAASAGAPAAGSTGAIAMERQIRSLQTDLAHDAHECDIGRKRMAQTECEHDFLWPAVREAADAIHEQPGRATADAPPNARVCTAQGRIEHYLAQLEGRWPTL